MAHKNDIRAMDALRSNVERGYAQLYTEHFGMVRHLVTHNSGNPEEAKDLFQDAVIALYEMSQAPGFVLRAKLSTLLYSIARRLWLKRLRDAKPKFKLRDNEQHIAVDLDDGYDYQKEEQLTAMERSIEALGQPCKGLLIGFYYRKQSMQDLASNYDYGSADHAKAQKYKCLQRLKKMAAQWK